LTLHPHDFEVVDFLNKVGAQLGFLEVLVFPIESDNLRSNLFFFWFSAFLEEWVVKAFVDREAEVGVEHKNLVKQVDSFITSSRVNGDQIHALALGERV
jgi:hypothetical protein